MSDVPFTEEDAERESLDNSEPEEDDGMLGSIHPFKVSCICGRKIALNPFGGKVRCPVCGAEVGP